MKYLNNLFYFMHPVTKTICYINNGRSMWEDQKDKADWVVVKVLGPAMDHWEEAMNYGVLGSSQPKRLDINKYINNTADFKADALEALGITNNPKAEMLYYKAWELGHAHGIGEVWGHMQDLTPLIKE